MIYKNCNGLFMKDFYKIFISFSKLYTYNISLKTQNLDQFDDLVHILFYIVKNNIDLFTEFDLQDEYIKFIDYIIGFLNNIYAKEETNNKRNLLSIIKKIYNDLFEFIKIHDDIEECYVCEIIQDILFNDTFRRRDDSKYMRDIICFVSDLVENNNLDYHFFVEDDSYDNGNESEGFYYN
jgi:hypothetical protein